MKKKNDSKRSVVSRLVRNILQLALILLWAAEVNAYENQAMLQASKILPPELRSGANFKVEEKVSNDGYLNTYRLNSKFGTFTAVSTAMLRNRINEANALTVMEQVKGTSEFTKSLGGGKLGKIWGSTIGICRWELLFSESYSRMQA